MDLATILADAKIVVSLGTLALQVGEDAAPFLKDAYDILFSKKTLTDAERTALIAQETAMTAKIEAAFPDEA